MINKLEKWKIVHKIITKQFFILFEKKFLVFLNTYEFFKEFPHNFEVIFEKIKFIKYFLNFLSIVLINFRCYYYSKLMFLKYLT